MGSIIVKDKVWGREEWLVNNDEYCGKLLYLNQGATCSYHFHPRKKETFYCLKGKVLLTVNGVESLMKEPYTIHPNTPHQFHGITDAVIIEISTHHEDEDVVRLTESVCYNV